VVERDLTTEQEKQARLKDLSTLWGDWYKIIKLYIYNIWIKIKYTN
jgi:hypothetical protein